MTITIGPMGGFRRRGRVLRRTKVALFRFRSIEALCCWQDGPILSALYFVAEPIGSGLFDLPLCLSERACGLLPKDIPTS
jgi:hypothetical protein